MGHKLNVCCLVHLFNFVMLVSRRSMAKVGFKWVLFVGL